MPTIQKKYEDYDQAAALADLDLFLIAQENSGAFVTKGVQYDTLKNALLDGETIVDGVTNAVNLGSKTKAETSFLGKEKALLSANCYFDGADWRRLNDANPAAQLLLNQDKSLTLRTAAAGAGAITWTTSELYTAGGYQRVGGSTAPAVKMKLLTGTTASTSGGYAAVTHGINSSKIVAMQVLVEYSTGYFVPPGYKLSGTPGYEFYPTIGPSVLYIYNNATNSDNILSKPFRVLITYEE